MKRCGSEMSAAETQVSRKWWCLVVGKGKRWAKSGLENDADTKDPIFVCTASIYRSVPKCECFLLNFEFRAPMNNIAL